MPDADPNAEDFDEAPLTPARRRHNCIRDFVESGACIDSREGQLAVAALIALTPGQKTEQAAREELAQACVCPGGGGTETLGCFAWESGLRPHVCMHVVRQLRQAQLAGRQ